MFDLSIDVIIISDKSVTVCMIHCSRLKYLNFLYIPQMVKEIVITFLFILAQGAIFDSQLTLKDPFALPDPFQKNIFG